MPEKPEVQHTADCLHKILKGQVLAQVQYKDTFQRAAKGLKNYAELCNLLPLSIRRVYSKGKKIIFCLKDHVYLMSSLSMEGKWLLKRHNHSNLWLQLEDGRKIYYDDTRHFGHFDIYLDQVSLQVRLDTIGPDLLLEKVTKQDWLNVVRGSRVKHMEIAYFVHKQKYFSGVGNYIRAEALYRARIRPDAKLHEISDRQHNRVRKACINVIRESYESRGCTLRTYWNVEGEPGGFIPQVYDLNQDAEGNAVVKYLCGKQKVHWVPAVQVYPARVELVLDHKKLKADGYTAIELKELCKQYKVSPKGTKVQLKERLLEVK